MNAMQWVRVATLAGALAASSCTAAVREGTGTSFLIIDRLEASSGAEPEDFGGTLLSDVVTVVGESSTFFNDIGRVTFRLGLKDPGPSTNPNAPTQNQFITVTRYRVRYLRADGRNTPGVDVPYPFDGAFTATVGASTTTVGFDIVRNSAKLEAPLAALARSGLLIATIAEVTFFGRDQTGKDVSATGQMTITFGNFGDPGA